ncbi:sorcin-like [Carassius auratus]|uniref:Sorcin-like n=1 Tax=Carassius auratus TaxID=7957 RepID=A0A6P6KC74_CARAU|nr:sorcin-like [Carassius auratus]XP_052455183.1 sorcin-like [Carassius gibelio]
MAYPGYNNFGGPPMPGVPAQGMAMPGHPAAGGYPAQQYAGYPGTFPAPSTQDPMWGYFTAVAGQDGEVDAEELQRCLTQTGISGSYTPFSLETCRIMIAMLDKDYSGKMGFNEFKELLGVLNGWKQNFVMVDRDGSGTVEPHEMSQSIANMGYRISPQALNAIIKRYSRSEKIYFDDYVACFVKLRALTENFKRRDTMQQGMVNFQYDDFMLCTMSL